jgi:F-type H+-transporting ATPase subunit a
VNEKVKPKRRFGVKRWIILALIIAGVYAAFIGPSILKPVSPIVILAAEPTGLHIGNFQITNSILATLFSDVVLLLIVLFAYRFVRSGKLVPSGFYNAFEAIFEFLWNSVESSAGKWARKVFPIAATIFLLIFVANLVKLIPGFESIGLLEQSPTGSGYAPVKLFQIGGLEVMTVDKSKPVTVSESSEGAATSSTEGACTACVIIPYFRGSATDLNFPLALAIATVILTQIFGIWAIGPGFLSKYFPIRELVSGGIFGMINFGVGILEAILEFAKILSFTFRLFGNIFAGVLLISIIGALVSAAIPPFLYIFEVFFGIIQAYIFFLLATVFISSATIAHLSGHD